jgi:GH35 family endo-1,4-beta-xylanase
MNRGTLGILLTAAFALVILAAYGPPARAARGMEIALQDDSAFVAQIGIKRKKALALAARLHVTRLRVNLPWASIVDHPNRSTRPKHRHYDFTSYDALYNDARTRGIKLQFTITGFAPAWATGDRRVGCYRIRIDYLKEFVRAVVKHFKGHIDRYSVWNEPNHRSWNGPLSSAASTYREMYLMAYHEIRSIDPAAKILIGETAPYGEPGVSISPLTFIRDMARRGKLKADGYAHHPYNYTRSPYNPGKHNNNAAINTLRNLTEELDKLAAAKKLTTPGGKPLDLYLTEYGFMASGKYRKSDKQRAKFLAHAFQIALDNPRVREMLQYLLVPPPPASSFFDTSIVTKRGKPTKPFKSLEAWTTKQAKRKMIALPY